jgi:putative Holliday junction resolvase
VTRLIGLDVGDRRVGVAVGDPDEGVARPLATFVRGDAEADAIIVARLAREQGASEIVVGLPLEADGREGDQAVLTREWADGIARRTGLGVTWRDERFTTVAAEARQPRMRRQAQTGEPTRGAILRRRARVDREAAARILQAELEARAAAHGGSRP